MLPMNNKTVRFLARMGARGTLGQAVYDYMKDGNEAFAVSADLFHASGFDRLLKDFPEQVLNVGIAEQNLIGVSAGLSRSGIPVVATSWAMFTSARVADQVRNFMGYMQSNVKLIGLDSGFIQSRFSYSHSNPPDIAIMRAIPGIVILSPCDGIEIYKSIYAALEYKGPVYIRLTGSSMLPVIYKDPGFDYQIGKAITVQEGKDVALIGCGNIIGNLLEAAALLEGNGISAKVIDMHTIAPIDKEILDEIIKYKLVATAEEHLLHGGLGSAVAEYYCEKKEHPVQLMFGIDNHYPVPGRVQYIEQLYGLRPEQISQSILKKMEAINGI